MNSYGVGQDEFIFRMYSIALIAISGAATVKGDMMQGIIFMLHPGTYAEHLSDVPMEERSWSSFSKFLVMLVRLNPFRQFTLKNTSTSQQIVLLRFFFFLHSSSVRWAFLVLRAVRRLLKILVH